MDVILIVTAIIVIALIVVGVEYVCTDLVNSYNEVSELESAEEKTPPITAKNDYAKSGTCTTADGVTSTEN